MVMKPYRLLIFDWDGTLADSTAQIVRGTQAAFAHFGWAVPPREAVLHVIGLSLSNSLYHLKPDATEDDVAKLRSLSKLYLHHPDNTTILFDDAARLLPRLAEHYTLAVATGKGRAGLEKSLDDTGTRPLFAATRTVDECASKPAPDMVLSLCSQLGIAPDEAVVLGDTTHDIWMGHNAGTDAVAVLTGAHSEGVLRQAPACAWVENFGAFAQWLGLPD